MRDALCVARTGKHLVRRSVDGSGMDRSELGLKQCSFHHTIQILRVCDFCAFSSPPALPPCYFPLCLSTSGKVADLRDLLRVPGYWVAIQLELSRRTHRLHKCRQLLLWFVRHTGRFVQTGHVRSAIRTSSLVRGPALGPMMTPLSPARSRQGAGQNAQNLRHIALETVFMQLDGHVITV